MPVVCPICNTKGDASEEHRLCEWCKRAVEWERKRGKRVLAEGYLELEKTTFEQAFKNGLLIGIEEAEARLYGIPVG